ncbi:MAG: AsmA family protein [Deltaproteobacteria bacterium]|nr:MAG: AsmA family protein [Deltaproteobacteria bacterium]
MKATRWKKIGIILAVLALVVIAAALIVPRFIDLNRYNGLITSKLEAATGGKVTLGALKWGITNGVWLEADGFALKGATSFPGDVDMSRLYAKVSVLPLLSKKVVVNELLLQNPVVGMDLAPSPKQEKRVRTKPGETTPTGADTAPSADKGSLPLPVEILIRELNIEKGRIKLENLPGQEFSRIFSDVEVEAQNLAPGKEVRFQFALRDEAKAGFGSLKGQGTLRGLTEALTLENPGLMVKVTLSGLNVDVLKPYIKDKSLAQRLGGSISLEVNYQGDFGRNFSADGNVDLTQFLYTDLSKWDQPLPQAETKIAYKLVASPDQMKVEKFSLSLGSISLKGEGLLRDWRKEAIVKSGVLTGNLPLVELLPLVPWRLAGKKGQVIWQGEEIDGKITIDRLVFPELSLTRLPSKIESLLSKIEGSARISDVSVVPSTTLRVTGGNGAIELAGNRVNLNDVTLLVNDQKMSGSGQITNFQEPTLQIQVKSPILNLDRLLPPKAPDKASSKAKAKSPGKQESKPEGQTTTAEKKTKKGELHPLLRKLTAVLQLDANRGTYRGQEFQALKLNALYEKGVLKSHDFEILIGGGRIQSRGSADLRSLEQIAFALQPTIKAVPLESLAVILGTEKPSVNGPLTLTGELQGTTGRTLDLLRSLRGNIEAEMGPGRIYKLGQAGNALFGLLNFLSVSNILSGKTVKEFATEGAPYQSIKARTLLQGGKMNISQLAMESPALELDANGDVDLLKKQLKMNGDIGISGTLDKVLSILSKAGKGGTESTRVHVTLEGAIENPKIRIRSIKGVSEAGKKGTQEGGKIEEDVIKEFGKGLEKILGK